MTWLETVAYWAQIVALPVAVVAVVITIILYHRTRQKRAISCEFEEPEFPVEIRPGGGLQGDIEIRYAGRPIANLYLLRATIRNSGNTPIRASDVVEPLTFTFSPKLQLLREPRIVEPNPPDLQIQVILEPRGGPEEHPSAQLQFALLNPSERFTVEFLCTGSRRIPKVSARIEGVSGVERVTPEDREYRRSQLNRWGLFGVLTAGALFTLALPWIEILQNRWFGEPKGLSESTTALILAGLALLQLLWIAFQIGRRRYRSLTAKAAQSPDRQTP